MQESAKTKEELLDELVAMRQRVAELEASSTQQQQLEAALQAERSFADTLLDVTDNLLQNFLRSVLELDNTLVVVYDLQGRIINFNQTCEQTTGYSFDEVQNQPIWDLFLISAEVESAKAAFAELLAGRSAINYTNYWLTKQGSCRRISWCLTPLLAADGEVQYVISTGVDITEKAMALAALTESEEKFRSAFDYAAIGMALVSPDGRWLKVNQALCEIVGYSEQELVTKNFQDITHPDDLEIDLNYMHQMLADEIRHYQRETRYFHKQGHVVWVLLSASLVRSPDNQPLYFISQIQNITKRKVAEQSLQQLNEELDARVRERTAELMEANEELQAEIAERQKAEANLALMNEDLTESEERFRLLIEGVKDYAFFIVDRKGYIISWNKGAERITGYTASEIIGAHFSRLCPPEDVERGKPYLQLQVATAQGKYEEEGWRVRKDGSQFFANITVTALRDENGSLRGFSEVTRDVTSRKRDEEMLQKWGEIFQHTGQGLIITSPGSRFLETINPALAAMHGYAVEELASYRLSTIIAPECLEESLEHILLSYDYDKYSFESLHLRKDGTIFPVYIEVTNVRRSEEEKVIYRIFNVQDITARKQAEEDIRNAWLKEKEVLSTKTRLIAIASHEFRTPLATILSANELLKYYSHKLPADEKQDLYRQIETATKHMLELIDDFLAISKAEAEKIEFKPVPLNLEVFCCQILSELQLSTGKKHELVFTISEDCTSAVMDEKLLRHIFSNLLSNAIKYSPAGGMVDLSVEREDGNAVFKVKDSGIGIPPEDREKLFESFHRASNVGNIPGTGLGLSIVKRMVEVHGGTISVESEVGVGTTFVVNIPLSR